MQQIPVNISSLALMVPWHLPFRDYYGNTPASSTSMYCDTSYYDLLLDVTEHDLPLPLHSLLQLTLGFHLFFLQQSQLLELLTPAKYIRWSLHPLIFKSPLLKNIKRTQTDNTADRQLTAAQLHCDRFPCKWYIFIAYAKCNHPFCVEVDEKVCLFLLTQWRHFLAHLLFIKVVQRALIICKMQQSIFFLFTKAARRTFITRKCK